MIFLGILLAIFCPACESAFAPQGADGDADEADGDQDQEEDEEIETFNLKLNPDFMRRGDTTRTGSIAFKNEEEIRGILEETDEPFSNWQISYGEGVFVLAYRFNMETLAFENVELFVSPDAPTKPHTVTARLVTFRNETIVLEHGTFFVLPSLEQASGLQPKN